MGPAKLVDRSADVNRLAFRIPYLDLPRSEAARAYFRVAEPRTGLVVGTSPRASRSRRVRPGSLPIIGRCSASAPNLGPWSRQRTQNRQTSSSSWAICFAVKTRDKSPRCALCAGGSSNITKPLGSSISAFMMSRMSLRVLEKTRQFTNAFWTSSCRASVQKSYRSL
jgi:hypothetical protein